MKSRDVVRPAIIGDYFEHSNIIDVGNQLRQNELALERYWLTKDPWFRIDTTIVGISVIDAYLAAQYQAPPCAGLSRMSVKDYALHTVYDLWNRPISKEPKSVVQIASSVLANEESIEVEIGSGTISFDQIMLEHVIKSTNQRSNAKKPQLFRQACSMIALSI